MATMTSTMPRIHPTAIIDPRAELADDVEVGPWCIIDGEVKLGPGTRLLERVSLRGPLTVGARNVLYPGTCLGFEPQDRKFDPVKGTGGVAIGDDNILREGVTIHRATGASPTRLGDRNMLMVNSHLGHDAVVANDCVLANGALLAGHVVLQDKVILGGNAAVHQFCRVGRLAMLSGGAVISQDLPPFCVSYHSKRIGSLNLIGLRRSGAREHIDPLSEAFDIFFKGRHTAPQAVELIEQKLGSDALCVEFAAFIRGTKRGITGYVGNRDADGGE